MKKTALIMAGGRGERFWPKSRKNLPKQFLSLTDDGKTMIQMTVERIRSFVDLEDIYIASNKDYKALILEQLPGIPEGNILCEPIGRNTAPCIGLGAVHIAEKYEDAVMIVLPSDHLVKSNDIFADILQKACETAEKGEKLITVGITPNYPETGYGYIKFNRNQTEGDAYAVDRFVEKPSLETAKEYLAEGDYLWNSGMFVWKVSAILSNIRICLPDIWTGLKEIQHSIGTKNQEAVLAAVFPKFEPVSIDYGVMEKADNIFVFPGNFGWDDVGSWLAVGRLKKSDENGNVMDGNIIAKNCRNNIFQGSSKLIAAAGVENMIVIDTEDVTLICDKECTTDIKKILDHLKNCHCDKYL